MEILAIPPAHVDAGFRLAGAIVSNALSRCENSKPEA
jgi:hypothetical protein